MLAKIVRKIRHVIKRRSAQNEEVARFLSIPSKPVDSDNSYVIFVHGARYGGAPLLGLDIAKELHRQGKQIVIVSLGYGPLIKNFSEVTHVQICINEQETKSCLKSLSDLGFQKAICNGALTGKCVPALKEYNYYITALIHELPGVIKYFGADKDVKNIIKYSDSLIYPAKYVRQQIEQQYGINKNTIVLHQGLANTTKNTLTKAEAKKKIADTFEFNENMPLFINVATINERKGFDLFVAMSAIDNSATYLWIGDGIDGRFGKKVQHKYGSFPDNLIVPGYVNDKEMLDTIYRAADLLLLTSREEPFGTIVLEAFSRETPVVAFKGCGGYEDVVIPLKTGALVQPFDIRKMVAESHAILKNCVKLEQIREECYKIANESDFSEYCGVIVQQVNVQ